MTANESWKPLLEELNTQQECLDMMSAAWTADYRSHGGTVFCGRGCRECCSLTVNCTLTEAVALAQSMNDTQAQAVKEYADLLGKLVTPEMNLKEYLRMQRREMWWCPLLDDDDACSVYASRPLSCRALLSTKESFFCGVDFAELISEEKQAYAQSLDNTVTEYPLHYVAFTRETGREFETRALALMRKNFGFSVYGTMPVLVHFVLSWGFTETVFIGRDAGEAVATQAGLIHPFLVQFSS